MISSSPPPALVPIVPEPVVFNLITAPTTSAVVSVVSLVRLPLIIFRSTLPLAPPVISPAINPPEVSLIKISSPAAPWVEAFKVPALISNGLALLVPIVSVPAPATDKLTTLPTMSAVPSTVALVIFPDA